MQQISSQTKFAARLNEICDDMKLPLHGRQTMLARQFGVTQGATKKWMNGDAYPNLDKIVAICEWAGVNVNWLLMGTGPKRIDIVDTKSVVLGEALESLPSETRDEVLDFLHFKLERSPGLFAGERMARYLTMIDAFKRDRERLR